MQSASPRRLELDGEVVRSRIRAALGDGHLVAFIIVALLTLSIANSTATAQWVTGIGVITLIALAGAVSLGILAILPVPWAGGLGLGMLAGPVIALVVAWPALHAAHPTDTLDLRLIGTWAGRVSDGSAASDPSFYLFLICWLMWVTGAWLSWCVLRWRKPMLGLIPGAAAFATNVLNFPTNQNGYTLAMLVFTLALLLWSNYTSSIANANRARVRLTGDAKWDFWESGLVAMAGLIVVGILLPPMSTVDKTVDLESSMFSNWATLQQRLSHPGIFNSSPGGGGTTGFSTDVKLSGPLQRTRDIVFEYTIVGDYAGPRYFRGVDVTLTQNGEWRYAGVGLHDAISKNQTPQYGEEYQKLALAGFNIKMLRPPIGNSDILFYPGQLERVDRQSLVTQVPLPAGLDPNVLKSIDRLSSLQPGTSAGSYKVYDWSSTATIGELRAAGTGYPDWVQPFMTLSPDYRPPDVLAKIHDLAVQVVTQAKLDPATASPYDIASAIEAYLRSNQFSYTLIPPVTPDGVDTMDYFLFTSHKGYCEYFATAMGDMLRSLGIPTRLVNGFGPGQFDSTVNSYVVRGEDAHTWVEVYFPSYGWIPFEPTNDNSGAYNVIERGLVGQGLCLRDENCVDPTSTGTTVPTGGTPQITPHTGGRNEPATTGGGGVLQVSGIRLDANTALRAGAIFVALILLLLAVAARYLRPRSVMTVWRRTMALARLAGAERRPGETPLELGRRWQQTFPEAAEPVGALARGFVVAAYAPPDLASSSRASVMEAWVSLRPMLLRRVFARIRPTRI
ncbi:MAG TPA: transglutaminase domain-containing protein [Candidatus Dormibacteraeota bacterium]|nr:transglutaminase domain-containing protein [Candidatus Dormibacteraeota bacterium]